jgi:hypothetical protein
MRVARACRGVAQPGLAHRGAPARQRAAVSPAAAPAAAPPPRRQAVACFAARAAASAAADDAPEPFFWRGGDTLRVPMALHAENRARLRAAMCEELEARGMAPGIVVLQARDAQLRARAARGRQRAASGAAVAVADSPHPPACLRRVSPTPGR